MKTVLVTGATGAFGRAVITRLKKNGNHRVIATSRTCDDENCLQLDVRNIDQLAATISRNKPDLILHLAATFVNDFDEAFAINVGATRRLLDVIQQTGISTRVVLIGSAAEYGVVLPEDNPVREDRVLNPVSVYGLTKAWQTQMAGLYASRGVDVVVARLFNLEGPGLSERLFIGRLQHQIDEVLAGRKAEIELGTLTAIRDYVSTDQAADQLLAIAAYGIAGGVYHVASGKPVTMRDILNRYLAIHKLNSSIVREGAKLTNRTGYDVPAIYADITNTLQLMGTKRDKNLCLN